MQSRLIRDIIFLLAGFGIIWFLATLFFFDKKNPEVLSVEKESEIGDYIFANISKNPQYQIIESVFIDSCMDVITGRLIHNLESEYDYKAYIFANPMIKAFALPGGYIMISSGLAEITDNPEEIASIIAHEMAHIEEKHLISKLVKGLGLKLILSNDALVLSEVSHLAASTAYDRKKETQADQFALELLYDSKIDPRILGVVFRKLKNAEADYDERFEMIMTHPHSDSRIRNALGYEVPESFETDSLNLNWGSFKAEFLAKAQHQ